MIMNHRFSYDYGGACMLIAAIRPTEELAKNVAEFPLSLHVASLNSEEPHIPGG